MEKLVEDEIFMNEKTINNDVTMGGASATLLAGRYRVVRQLGQGGMGSVFEKICVFDCGRIK